MARSTDDSDDRRKRRPKNDLGYEVIPDDDDEEVEEKPRRKRKRQDDDDDDRPRRRRRPVAFPTRAILGILCGIATPLCALAAINGTIQFVAELSSGNWHGIGVFFATVIHVVLVKLYSQAAMVIWQGNADEYDFRTCGIASFVIGGIASLPMCSTAMRLFSGHTPPKAAVVGLVVVIALVSLLMGIGLLSFIEAGVFKGDRRRRTR